MCALVGVRLVAGRHHERYCQAKSLEMREQQEELGGERAASVGVSRREQTKPYRAKQTLDSLQEWHSSAVG